MNGTWVLPAVYETPENLRHYFDFEKYARDLQLDGAWFFSRVGGTFYAFSTI